MTETALHKAVARYLDLALPRDAEWQHCPLQGQGRGKKNGGVLHGMGARAGWPDIEILWRNQVHFIELKGPKGTLSPAQKERFPRLDRACGGRLAVCRSLDDVQGVLRAWGLLSVPARIEPHERAA